MQTDCNPKLFAFEAVERKSVVAAFDVALRGSFQLPTSSLRTDDEAEGDVLKPSETAPDDHVAWRRVTRAGEVAAKQGDLKDIGGQGSIEEAGSWPGRIDLVEGGDLGGGEDGLGLGVGVGARGHRDPEDAPADDGHQGQQLHKPLGGAQLGVFGAQSGLHDFVEHLDLPAQGVPAKFFRGPGEIIDRQIGDKLPVDPLPILGSALFKGVDVGQGLRGIAFLLADGGKVSMAANLIRTWAVSPSLPATRTSWKPDQGVVASWSKTRWARSANAVSIWGGSASRLV